MMIEITKSAVETHRRTYETEIQHGTATIMRLVKPWLHTNRHISADSFFATVSIAIKLRDVGLRLTGAVKTATRLYRIQSLSGLKM